MSQGSQAVHEKPKHKGSPQAEDVQVLSFERISFDDFKGYSDVFRSVVRCSPWSAVPLRRRKSLSCVWSRILVLCASHLLVAKERLDGTEVHGPNFQRALFRVDGTIPNVSVFLCGDILGTSCHLLSNHWSLCRPLQVLQTPCIRIRL